MLSAGVQRLLENVLKTLTATSLMSLSATSSDGAGRRGDHVYGRAPDSRRHDTLGTLLTSTLFFWRLLVAPVFQIVGIGPQITEALAGLERTREVLNERPEDEAPERRRTLDRIRGRSRFSKT